MREETEEKSGGVDSVTIVIPTHNRAEFLIRLLEYYRPISESIVVADSSVKPLNSHSIPEGISYRHLPGVDFDEKLRRVLRDVETKYVQFVADDDFVLIDSLEKARSFLDRNLDYGSAQGWHIGFRYIPSSKVQIRTFSRTGIKRLIKQFLNLIGIKRWPLGDVINPGSVAMYGMHQFAKDLEVSDPDPMSRVVEGMNPYMNVFYSLHRKEIVESYFFDLCPRLLENRVDGHANLAELGQAMNSLFWGKHKILQVPWIFREQLDHALSGSEMAPITELFGSNDPLMEGFLNGVAVHLAEMSPDIEKSEVREVVKNALAGFVHEFSPAWETGKLPHGCEVEDMITSERSSNQLREIEEIVLKYKAELSEDWI